jgi:hypothetical protein
VGARSHSSDKSRQEQTRADKSRQEQTRADKSRQEQRRTRGREQEAGGKRREAKVMWLERGANIKCEAKVKDKHR